MQLCHSTDSEPGFIRKGRGRGFSYYDLERKLITEQVERERINRLAIPPAYQDVWICPLSNGHIQATGRDEKGRKQYRYHEEWRRIRNQTKFSTLVKFGKDLSCIRRNVRADLNDDSLTRRRIIASAIRLIDHTGARVGNDYYTQRNGSHGVTTLRKGHVESVGEDQETLNLHYVGKGGKEIRFTVSSPLLTRAVLDSGELPGKRLFKYENDSGQVCSIESHDVNDYLGKFGEGYTAKMFRTWKASLLTFAELVREEPSDSQEGRNRQVSTAISAVANQLFHRPATCRKYYVHPDIISAFIAGDLGDLGVGRIVTRPPLAGLSTLERKMLHFLGE